MSVKATLNTEPRQRTITEDVPVSITLTVDIETAKVLKIVAGLGTAHWDSMAYRGGLSLSSSDLVRKLHPVAIALGEKL